MRIWVKAGKKELDIIGLASVLHNRKEVYSRGVSQPVEGHFNDMEKTQPGAKNVNIIILLIYRVLLHCLLDCDKIHLLRKFLIL